MFLYFTEKTLSDSGIAVLEVFFLLIERSVPFLSKSIYEIDKKIKKRIELGLYLNE
jgi:hypothetical protein